MKNLIALAVLLASSTVFAQKMSPHVSYSMPAVEAGFRWSSADLNGATSNKQDLGFQLGASAVINFNANFGLKTGLFYAERPFKADYPGGEVKGKLTYFEVPALLMFKLEEYAGLYVGPSLAFKLGDEVTPGTLTGIKGMIVPVTLGAQFKFTPNLGLNVFFESVSGELATGIENARAVGVNLMFALD